MPATPVTLMPVAHPPEQHALQTSARLITATIQKLAQMVLYTVSMEQRLARQEAVNVAAQMDLMATIVTNALLEKVSMV